MVLQPATCFRCPWGHPTLPLSLFFPHPLPLRASSSCSSSLPLQISSRLTLRQPWPSFVPLLVEGSSAPVDCSWKVLASSRAFYELVLVLVLGWLPLRICALMVCFCASAYSGIGAACFFFTKPRSSSLSCWVLLSKQNLTLIVSSSTKSTPLKMSVDSGIEDYSIGSASSINNKNVRILVTIPGAMMLDHMLMQLGLPPAEYQHKLYGDNKTCVSVTFNTSLSRFPCPHDYIRYQEHGRRCSSPHSSCRSHKVSGKCS